MRGETQRRCGISSLEGIRIEHVHHLSLAVLASADLLGVKADPERTVLINALPIFIHHSLHIAGDETREEQEE